MTIARVELIGVRLIESTLYDSLIEDDPTLMIK